MFRPLNRCGDHFNTPYSGSLRRPQNSVPDLWFVAAAMSTQILFLPLSRVLAGDHVNSYCKKKDLILTHALQAILTITLLQHLFYFNNRHAGWQPGRCATIRMCWMATGTSINTDSEPATMAYDQNDLTPTYRRTVDESLSMRHIFDSSPPPVAPITWW